VADTFRRAGADVVHRSALYSDRYPDLPALVHEADGIVVVFRDHTATLRSRWERGEDEFTAVMNLLEAYRAVMAAASETPPNVSLLIVTYEAIVARPAKTLTRMLAFFGLRCDDLPDVHDGNAKYLDE
jgi:hypothetical protein